MTKQDKEDYLKIFKDATSCYDICFACKDWCCDYRSPQHILECRRFKPKEKKNEQS